MVDLKITLIQSEIVWENIEENLETFDKRLVSMYRPD